MLTLLRRGDGGFTLVELLVAMSVGLIVVFGASALIISSLASASRVSARVQAVAQARTGLEQLLQQLDSGCVVSGVSPLQPSTAVGITPVVQSDDSHLVFVSGLDQASATTPTEHVVSVVNGALVDTAYRGTGGTPPRIGLAAGWTFDSTAISRATLIEHVLQSPPAAPMFQYSEYSSTPSTLTPAGTQPGSSAPSVAQIDINLTVDSADAAHDAGPSAHLQDDATFRLTPADPTSTNYPCQ